MANPAPPTPADLDFSRPEFGRLARLLQHRPLTLTGYHAVGEQLRRLADDPAVAAVPGWRAKAAEHLGVSEATLNKALQFRRSYETADLPALEELGVGWSLVTVALGVADKKKRQRLLRQAVERGWVDRDLQRHLQRLRGRRRGGGRPRREVQGHGLVPDLAELTSLTKLWTDFHAKVWAAGQEAYAAELAKLPEDAIEGVGRLLDGAAAKLKELRRRCGEALEAFKSMREQLPPGE